MKKLLICLSVITFGFSTLLADDLSKQPSKIDLLISEIKNAKSSDKRILMNQLKVKLRTMNQETRIKSMKDLRKSFNKNSSNQMQQNRSSQNSKNNMQEQRGKQQPVNRPMHHKPKRGK